jgi:hypothetical protein
MIDKLELRTDFMKADAIEALANSYDHYLIGDKNYRDCCVFKFKGNHVVTVKTRPVFPNASFCSIELNPSKFESFKQMTDLISIIADQDLLIKRIDFAVDLPVPLEQIRKAIKARHKRIRHDYKENDVCTGFELGSDQEIICIYDKAYELLTRRKYRRLNDQTPRVMTRIEIRLRSKKIPLKRFEELTHYVEINPFEILEFYKINSSEEISEFQHFRLNKFLFTLDESGCLHGAIKRLNSNNNFKRDNTYLVRDSYLETFIANQLRENLTTFLGSQNEK